jgi:phage tail-like protein
MVDPLTTHRFAVEIDGLVLGAFDECSGLAGTLDVYEYKEGGLNSYTHKLPGRISWGTITLKWGTTDSTRLWDWFKAISAAVNKSRHYRNVSIIQFKERAEDRAGTWMHIPGEVVRPSMNAAQVGLDRDPGLACADVTR